MASMISKTRGFLYMYAKILGHVSAVQKGTILQRFTRVKAGQYTARGMGSVFDRWR